MQFLEQPQGSEGHRNFLHESIFPGIIITFTEKKPIILRLIQFVPPLFLTAGDDIILLTILLFGHLGLNKGDDPVESESSFFICLFGVVMILNSSLLNCSCGKNGTMYMTNLVHNKFKFCFYKSKLNANRNFINLNYLTVCNVFVTLAETEPSYSSSGWRKMAGHWVEGSAKCKCLVSDNSHKCQKTIFYKYSDGWYTSLPSN